MDVAVHAPEPSALAVAWPIAPVVRISPTEPGHNNRSWVIETENGTYVLRLYDNLGEKAIRYEHELLRTLSGAGLPFAVPSPLDMSAGGSLLTADVDGKIARAAMFPFLPGRHPFRDDPTAAEPLGEALARLHPALKAAGEVLGSPAVTGYGDIKHIHPSVPDPMKLGDLLELDQEPRAKLHRAIERAFDTAASLYERLPQQLIHADYGSFNVLMEGGRVSAVLDFEFSCNDVRAMDLANGIRDVGHDAWFAGADLDLCERFARGYASVQRPADDEIAAIPDLMRLAVVVILVHWTGRWLQGITARSQIEGAVEWALTIDSALDARGYELVERLLRAIA